MAGRRSADLTPGPNGENVSRCFKRRCSVFAGPSLRIRARSRPADGTYCVYRPREGRPPPDPPRPAPPRSPPGGLPPIMRLRMVSKNWRRAASVPRPGGVPPLPDAPPRLLREELADELPLVRTSSLKKPLSDSSTSFGLARLRVTTTTSWSFCVAARWSSSSTTASTSLSNGPGAETMSELLVASTPGSFLDPHSSGGAGPDSPESADFVSSFRIIPFRKDG